MAGDTTVEVEWVGAVNCHDELLVCDVEAGVETSCGVFAGGRERSLDYIVVVVGEVEGDSVSNCGKSVVWNNYRNGEMVS